MSAAILVVTPGAIRVVIRAVATAAMVVQTAEMAIPEGTPAATPVAIPGLAMRRLVVRMKATTMGLVGNLVRMQRPPLMDLAILRMLHNLMGAMALIQTLRPIRVIGASRLHHRLYPLLLRHRNLSQLRVRPIRRHAAPLQQGMCLTMNRSPA